MKSLTGEDVEFDIQTGGAGPQLYAPTVSLAGNSVEVNKQATGTGNGGYAQLAKVLVTIDGVTTQLTGTTYQIQPGDDGKVAGFKLSRQDFQDSSEVTITLVYIDPTGDQITFNISWRGSRNAYRYRYLCIQRPSDIIAGNKWMIGGNAIDSSSPSKTCAVLFVWDTDGDIIYPSGSLIGLINNDSLRWGSFYPTKLKTESTNDVGVLNLVNSWVAPPRYGTSDTIDVSGTLYYHPANDETVLASETWNATDVSEANAGISVLLTPTAPGRVYVYGTLNVIFHKYGE
jgi:hypothetical protein